MIGTSQRRSAEFLDWEARGRGFYVWPHPVGLEPPFRPFRRSTPSDGASTDEGRKPTFVSSLVQRLSEYLAPTARIPVAENEEDSLPEQLIPGELREIQAYLPQSLKFDARGYGAFFTSLSVCAAPVAFELVATGDRIVAQFVVSAEDEALVVDQLAAFFPDVAFASVEGFLGAIWGSSDGLPVAAVEFGLGKEFVIPLQEGRSDPFVGLVGALGAVGVGEVAVFQVIFSPATAPWRDSIMRSVTHSDGSALFVNEPELLPAAKDKVSLPLFSAVVRLAVRGETHERTWEIACNAAGALGVYGSVRGNELIPLENSEYPAAEHDEDVVLRQSRRSGMLLNSAELAGFVHLPSSEVRSLRLRRAATRTKAAPVSLRSEEGLCLGTNVHAGRKASVVLTHDQRVRHTHIIGASGTGKSTLLFNLILQDIENGEGISVLDPHGDLIDRVLGAIPDHRIGDVVLLDPSDEESIVGFNIVSAHSDWEKNLLASDLVSVFRRLSSAWGDQLNSVLSNALLAFLESDRGGTLLDVRRFLLEPDFRNQFLNSVRDPNVVYYWRKAFPQLSGNKSVGPVVTRLDTFLSPKPIRYMVGQKENKLDFGDIMDSGKIFLAKLSQGAIGKENSHLLGSLIVAKIQAEAMSRQRQSESSRRYHWLYADEFHDFLTPSLAECLSGVRKYRLGLILPHQEMRQVERDGDVASALLNAYTRIVFRVNDRDARALESGFSSFEASDLQNLSTGSAVCRVERSDCDFNLTVDLPDPGDEAKRASRRELVVAASRKKYGTPRSQIEAALAEMAEPKLEPVAPDPKRDREMKAPPVPVPLPAKIELPAPEPISLVPEEKKAAAPLPDLGKGGAQHKAIQGRIKEAAERLGFSVVVEKEILGGAGQIDLALVRGEIAIACEVTISTTIDHEVGNVAKCVKAGFGRIALVSVSDDKLQKLSAAVSNSLGPEVSKCVKYYLPDAFIAFLGHLPRSEATAHPIPETRTRGGRIIRRNVVALSPEDATAKEEQALKLMAELMKKKKRVE